MIQRDHDSNSLAASSQYLYPRLNSSLWSSKLEGPCHPTRLDHLTLEILGGVDMDNDEVEVGRRGLGMQW